MRGKELRRDGENKSTGKSAEDFFGFRQVCMHELKGMNCMSIEGRAIICRLSEKEIHEYVYA
jgi:hypothetical protein